MVDVPEVVLVNEVVVPVVVPEVVELVVLVVVSVRDVVLVSVPADRE